MQVQIKFITSGANSAFGGFSAGDTMRCSDAMAKHLVDEMKCAKYITSLVAIDAETEQDAPKSRKQKSK